MTIEWVILFSVVVICLTVMQIMKKPKPETVTAELIDLQNQIDEIDKIVSLTVPQVEKLSAGFSEVHKVAEEAKKLLSQTNLSMAFVPRGKRQAGG